MLTYHAVGTGEVEYEFCTLDCQLGRWWHRTPQILANLYAKRIVTRQEQQIDTKRHIALPQFDGGDTRMDAIGSLFECVATGSEPTLLVELARIGQIGLRHNAYNLAVGNDKRTVIQDVFRLERRTYQHNDCFTARVFAYILQGCHGILLQGVREKQVGTRISRQTQLGKTYDLHTFVNSFGYELFGLLGVVRTVTYSQQRYSCCHTNKSKVCIHK